MSTGARVLLLITGLVVVLGVCAIGVVVFTDIGEQRAEPVDRTPEAQTKPTFTAGVQAGPTMRDARAAHRLGAPIARVELQIEEPVSRLRRVVAGYAREQVQVLVVSGFERRLPSPAEAKSLRAWALAVGPRSSLWTDATRHLAVRQIEFGTETSFAYQGTQKRGGEYAKRAREAAIALRGTGVGLLIQADDANQSDQWIDQMYDAVPDLHEYAAGWTVHPYGPQWRTRVDDTIVDTADHGAPRLPIALTEYGVASDDGRCLDKNYDWGNCLTYEQAAGVLRKVVRALRAEYPRVSLFVYYNNHDLAPPGHTTDAEAYFGAQQQSGLAKGALTETAKRIFATGMP
ncbi:MAG: hypothetical protein JHC95_10025 [Solirubrobacteraceae bacterium]|nr:hypothetical protein [Solirubrobacteraceae bacterium]